MDERNAPATKGDLATAVEQLEVRLAAAEERLDEKIEQLRSEMNHGYRELAERLGDGITRMLNAFYAVAETHGKRLGELDAGEAAIRSRLHTVENRLLELEKRINTPPAA